MKRVFLIVLSFLLLLSNAAPAVTGRAEGELYAVADHSDVYFYSEANEKSGLFILPYTYYVKVVNLGDPFCLVEYLTDEAPYKKVTGYCKKSELTFVDFVPVRPYLKREVTVKYSLSSSLPTVPSGAFDSVEVSYLYYGSYRAGTSLFYYVYGNGAFGYVPAEGELTYDLNTDYLQSTSGSEEDPPPETNQVALTGLQIALICVGCVLLVLFAFLVLRKRPAPPPSEEL